MFFSWFSQNKQFGKKDNLAGQITPLLLVVLVILLIAAIATINIGRVSLDKTCSANAADAGALAAASVYATGLNNLAQANANLEDNFDITYDGEFETTYQESDQHLSTAVTLAVAGSLSATALATLLATSSSSESCEVVWASFLVAVGLALAASITLEEAYVEVEAYLQNAKTMRSITDSFHDAQWEAFCESVVSMDSAYESSYNAGFTYAFSNSCIPSKLSNEQNDAFSLWMSSFTTDSGGTDDWILSRPAKEGVYSWQDKPSSEPLNPRPSQEHTVSATLDLPKITSYEVQHTVGSYSEIGSLLDYNIGAAPGISQALSSAATTLGAQGATLTIIFALSAVTAVLTTICENCKSYDCLVCIAAVALCAAIVAMRTTEMLISSSIAAILSAIVSAGGINSIVLVQENNREVYDDWGPDGSESVYNCLDCKPCRNDISGELASCVPCQAVSDMMIVRIADVIFPYWHTICTTTQKHPGASSGIIATSYPEITSSSEASFDGGDVGNFEYTYDSRITGTR
ncbi:MAG: pilus assembly protein TadG-related protein [Candidatus Omnitrophota bacterium]